MDGALWGPISATVAWWATVATLGALVTDIGPWYKALRQPGWKPPDAAFGPIWTTVFISASVGCVMALRGEGTDAQRTMFIIACVANGLGNVHWSYLFFRRRRPDWALLQVLPFWGTIFWMYWASRPLSYEAGIFFAPYLAWVAAAIKLNRDVVKLNGPFTG